MFGKNNYPKKVIAGCFLVAALMLAPYIISAQMPEYLIDNEDIYTSKKKPSVLFDHDLHTAVADCMDCHHYYKDGENVLEHFDLFEGAKGCDCKKSFLKSQGSVVSSQWSVKTKS